MEDRTVPTETIPHSADLVAELNDLLKLDHDAVQAYSLAIKGLENESYKATLAQFRGDHERHITELTELIRSRGGTPMEMPHLTSGPFKLAMQAIGSGVRVTGLAGDRAVLVTFKANERQVRDKYVRYAARPYPEEVARVVRQAADDEELHYRWVKQTLQALGYGEETLVGKANRVFGRVHGAAANAMEGIERAVMDAAYRARERGR